MKQIKQWNQKETSEKNYNPLRLVAKLEDAAEVAPFIPPID
jgi:hypothetical protein